MMPAELQTSKALLGSLLKDVSRSFYLTLRVLPASVRQQIGLAYLLARTSDTIADTELIPVDQRLAALQNFRGRVNQSNSNPLAFPELLRQQADQAERVLLENSEAAVKLLTTMAASDQTLIRQVLGIIISGQELDLCRFAGSSPENIIALETATELDDYTYRVAGCVGEFWTKICRAHVFPQTQLNDNFLLENGVRFGKGLQLVNILRDLPRDLRNGRCYLPATELLATCGLKPADLIDPSVEPRLRPLYLEWLDRAQAHLTAGWQYTNALPRKCIRVRLACAWPILLGLETIRLLRVGNVLGANQRIKTGRTFVRNMMLQSLLLYPFPKRWTALGQNTES